ncbi:MULTISPECIES: ATP-binding protein [Streptomyces]|uniref:ATP-binding protein n=1 Tax=Streptomyces sudanensis TaxID=436397 RepID=A0ABY4TDS5_9ACTN|nr:MULTISPECIES: ATP-binding protein [Streptomyces]MCP9957428.1 ATP-binding protein [Streptomyces sudanensis]MCP9986571.1 ATP-binding protein [Streptomyces sudanensis]MCQ0002024.1 ATP-binding protein [Streptomyces sudanensis]URN15130.1 ATP-binding protein [Streptomyces sudanensis]
MIGRIATRSSPQPPTTAAGPGFVVSFTPSERRVGHMRRITAAYLRHRGCAALTDDAVLVVSELVTNAVQHGKGEVGLRISASAGELCIEVSDGSTTPARLRSAGEDAEDGRGLLLVAALARTWGVSDDGTTTWCTLALPDGRL